MPQIESKDPDVQKQLISERSSYERLMMQVNVCLGYYYKYIIIKLKFCAYNHSTLLSLLK